MQILVVDDDPAIRAVLCAALRLHGHVTADCESADLAVQLLPYVDAVICDGLDYDSFKVVAWANRLEKPIVVFTASDEIVEAAAAIKIPCVRKPGSVQQLLEALMPLTAEVVG